MSSDRKIHKVSVRELIQYVLRSGDLESDYMGANRSLEGIMAHQMIQKSIKEGYESEVFVAKEMEYSEFTLKIQGRIDGIFLNEECPIIDEIKSTYCELDKINEDYNHLHWAQAKFYGYIYGEQKKIKDIYIQLTYINLESNEKKHLKKKYSIKELKLFFYNIAKRYGDWIEQLEDFEKKRSVSIQDIDFPYKKYRRGQRELALAVYNTIKEGESKKLFARAPTGTGKTLGTIFPALKAIGNNFGTKIFYLTAKTICRDVAEKTLDILQNNGLRIKRITLTAKDKICFAEFDKCNMKECPYTKGYYDRINDAVKDIITNENAITRSKIEEYAKKYRICPFEYSLDISLFVDCIICDYNYVFDPRINLKRFFSENTGDYIFLVDEAHNLVDRARSMFSAELLKKNIVEIKNKLNKSFPDTAKLYNKLNKFFIEVRKNCIEEKESAYVEEEFPQEKINLISRIMRETDEILTDYKEWQHYDQLLEVFFQLNNFVKIYELYDEKYMTYYEFTDDIKIKLFCLDPSRLLRKVMKNARATILFSATLIPMDYYIDILGGDKNSYHMMLASPFNQQNLSLLIQNKISTKYKDRELTYTSIVDSIYRLVKSKTGNYMIFFPSYAYMEKVHELFMDEIETDEMQVTMQSRGMTEEEKEKFLNLFEKKYEKSFVAFAIMGGSFSEGIDLIGDKLKGVVVIGVGLPQICYERNIIKNYFDKTKGYGFEYAYVYPGMNKVLQAVGRVIRTETDTGTALLIDQRFQHKTYTKLFPSEWSHAKYVNNSSIYI